jgi:DNA-binding protein H-NS
MAKSLTDLDALSVQELTELIAAAEQKRRDKLEDAKKALIAEIEQKAAALGLSVSDLYPDSAEPMMAPKRKPRKDAGQPVAIRYRGPRGEEWSGRGRRPTWLSEAINGGKSIEDFQV